MKKIYKKITLENDNYVTIYGANRWQQIYYNAKGEAYVRHYGRRYSLDLFMRVNMDHHPPDWMTEFHGIHNDSFFSGVLIKLSDCGESAKVFTYFS